MEDDNNTNGNLNDNSVLDALVFTREQWGSGTVKAVIFILIAVTIFFVPVTVRGNTDATFGIIYKNIKAGLGLTELWMGGIIVMGDGLIGVYGKYLRKNKGSVVYRHYQEDLVLHPLFYLLGSIFALILMLCYAFSSSEGPAAIVSPDMGETVYSTATDATWIIPVSAVFVPLLLGYGVVDFIGSLMESLMQLMFKIPRRSAVNAIAPFVSSASVGVLVASELYRKGAYTGREVALIVTGFSVINMGFTHRVMEVAGLSGYFLPIHSIAPLVTLTVNFFMVRIPPPSRRASVFADEWQQIKEKILTEHVPAGATLKTGTSRAVKKAATASNLLEEVRSSPLGNRYVLSKVISLPMAVGAIAMLIVIYTSAFNWTGKLFESLPVLLQVPNMVEIASSLPVKIVEMFLPVLMIAGKVGTLAVGARYIVITMSMVQIIFFSETIAVMMSTKIPVSLKRLIVYFFERTIMTIPINALFMHLLF